MILQQCSINGKKYQIYDGGIQETGKPNIIKLSNYREDALNFFQALAICHTVQVAGSEDVPLNQQQEESAMEASFIIVDDDDLSSGSEFSDCINTAVSCDSSEDNAKQNGQNILSEHQHLSPINNLNMPNAASNISETDGQTQHKRTNSNAPRISFNIDNKIYPTYSRSLSMEPVSLIPRPKSLAIMPIMPTTPSFGRKHLPKIASPLTINQSTNFNELNFDTPYKLTHRRTQSASVAMTKAASIAKSPTSPTSSA